MGVFDEINVLLYLVLYQFKLIAPYWIIGLLAGSFVSVYAKNAIKTLASGLNNRSIALVGMIFAAILGVASPVCMYGTVPLIAMLGRKGVPQHVLASFMVSSILINPNLFLFTFALGTPIALIRLFTCLAAGVIAGVAVKCFFKNKQLFNFDGFEQKKICDEKATKLVVYIHDLHRAIVKTAPYFFIGIILTAIFYRYVPSSVMSSVFGGNKKLGVILAASLGVPVYVCGGGTIPLLRVWMEQGMSVGAALAFMITGPATKLTNLSAVKIILGVRNFVLYIAFNLVVAIVTGLLVDGVFVLLK